MADLSWRARAGHARGRKPVARLVWLADDAALRTSRHRLHRSDCLDRARAAHHRMERARGGLADRREVTPMVDGSGGLSDLVGGAVPSCGRPGNGHHPAAVLPAVPADRRERSYTRTWLRHGHPGHLGAVRDLCVATTVASSRDRASSCRGARGRPGRTLSAVPGTWRRAHRVAYRRRRAARLGPGGASRAPGRLRAARLVRCARRWRDNRITSGRLWAGMSLACPSESRPPTSRDHGWLHSLRCRRIRIRRRPCIYPKIWRHCWRPTTFASSLSIERMFGGSIAPNASGGGCSS